MVSYGYPMEIKINLQDSLVGENYFKNVITGPYIRVTTSQESHIEDGLKFWWMKTSPEEIEKKQTETKNQGTVIHNYISGILNGESVNVVEDWCKPVIDEFNKFLKENVVIPQYVEKIMVSDALGIGGTADFIGTFNGQPAIIDWKTGAAYGSYKVQIAIYMLMHYENTGEFISNLNIVSIHRDAKAVKVYKSDQPFVDLRAGLLTFERWKFDNAKQLDWVCAPREVLEARSKTKSEKRIKFEQENWKPEYQWPWLKKDSLAYLNSIYDKMVPPSRLV